MGWGYMKNKILMIICALSLVVLMGCGRNYDAFAQCLTDNDVTFFGAFWCPHCQNQKNLFGGAMEYVNYVECSLPDQSGQTQICIDENIETYPTWEFSDGTRVDGVQTLESLSARSGCSLEVE